jgi:superfamily II DNA or RNA helicase
MVVDQVIIHPHNETHIVVMGSHRGIERELSEYFRFRVEGYMYMPKYKLGLWDGYIRLYNTMTKQIYYGLKSKVVKFAEDRGYEVVDHMDISKRVALTTKGVESFYERLKPFNKELGHITPDDYQIEGTKIALNKQRALIVSPTASGKSLIIYALARHYINQQKKVLILVSGVGLVKQMKSDFWEYVGVMSDFSADLCCHEIYSGKEKETDKPIVISTWQSIYKKPAKYFYGFDVILCDEVHHAKSDCIRGILEKAEKCKIRIGFTGTLDDAITNKYVLQGLFGDVHKVVTTKELMKRKRIANLSIKCVLLKYPEEERKKMRRLPYQDEVNFLVHHPKRTNFISQLALSQPLNTLVLFRFIEHGKLFKDCIEKKNEEGDHQKNVYFIYGQTDVDSREEIRAIVEKDRKAVILASYGVYKEGVNIQNLESVIFGFPSKAAIQTKQSIGRGLRFGRTGKVTLWDVVDDLSVGAYKNYTLKHFNKRVKYYDEDQFRYTFHKVE